MSVDEPELPTNNSNKWIRAGISSVAGAIPLVGGFFSAISSAWSEKEQEKANAFYEHWINMMRDELREKEDTIIEIMSRIDLQDQKISDRVSSKEYQSLLKKTFREWSGAESDTKREYIRNILANAASTDMTSDDVLKLFIDWINKYSEMHFLVIAAIYNSNGITRGQIWTKIGKGRVRENSADADLYKLLFRDLSTGSIIRQHRETDYHGNFLHKSSIKNSGGNKRKSPVSAFDNNEGYELTELGKQFIHYAMTDLPLKIEYSRDTEDMVA